MSTDVETLMTAWQDAWFTKNGRAIAEIMTDDYTYVAPNAGVMNPPTILGVVNDSTYALTGGTHTETVVSMLGEDAALVRRRWQGSGTYRGQAFVEDHRCVTILDRWSGRRWMSLMTKTSTFPIRSSTLSPSCSSIAVNVAGPTPAA